MDTRQQIKEITAMFHEKVAAFLRPEQAEDYMGAGVLPQPVMDVINAQTKKELGKSFSLRHPWLTGIPTLGIAPGVAKSRALDNIYRSVLRDPKHAKLIQGRWDEQRKKSQEDRMAEAKARQAEAKWEQAQQMRAALTEAAMQAAGAYKHNADLKYGKKDDAFSKTAAIHGAWADPLVGSTSPRIPMDYRLGLAQEYLDKKKQEKPTSRIKAWLGGTALGGLSGAGAGALLGAGTAPMSHGLTQLRRGGKGALIGGGLGALLGLGGGALASSIDRERIEEAKRYAALPPGERAAALRKFVGEETNPMLEDAGLDEPGGWEDMKADEALYYRRLLKKQLEGDNGR